MNENQEPARFTRPEPPFPLDLNSKRSSAPLGADGLTYPVGFFHFADNAATGAGIGGMLVTDNSGIPLEFMVTTAVRPSKAQQILYGKRLRSFIAIRLCGAELLRNIRTKPRVVFVADSWQLSLADLTDIPVLQLVYAEGLGDGKSKPTIVPPDGHPEYQNVLDLTSLDADMLDAFDRIEKCREVLAAKNSDYQI